MRKEIPNHVCTNILSYYLAANGYPDMIDSEFGADVFCVIKWSR